MIPVHISVSDDHLSYTVEPYGITLKTLQIPYWDPTQNIRSPVRGSHGTFRGFFLHFRLRYRNIGSAWSNAPLLTHTFAPFPRKICSPKHLRYASISSKSFFFSFYKPLSSLYDPSSGTHLTSFSISISILRPDGVCFEPGKRGAVDALE